MSAERGKPALISGEEIRRELAEFRALERKLLDHKRVFRFLAAACVTADSAFQKIRSFRKNGSDQ